MIHDGLTDWMSLNVLGFDAEHQLKGTRVGRHVRDVIVTWDNLKDVAVVRLVGDTDDEFTIEPRHLVDREDALELIAERAHDMARSCADIACKRCDWFGYERELEHVEFILGDTYDGEGYVCPECGAQWEVVR